MRFYLYLLITKLYSRYNKLINTMNLENVHERFDTINLYNDTESDMDYIQYNKIKDNFRKYSLLKKLENPNLNINTKLDLIDKNFEKSYATNLISGLEEELKEWED